MSEPVHGALSIMGGLLVAAVLVAITRAIVVRRLRHKRALKALQPASQLPPPLDEGELAEAEEDEYNIATSAIRLEAALADAAPVLLEDEQWDDEYAWPARAPLPANAEDELVPADDSMLTNIREEAMASAAIDDDVASPSTFSPQVSETPARRRKRKKKRSLNKSTECGCQSAGARSNASDASPARPVHADISDLKVSNGDASPHEVHGLGAYATDRPCDRPDGMLEGERYLDPLEA